MGTTISSILISYDINKFHTQVKVALEAIDYRNYFNYIDDKKNYYLPNTTLWHPKKTSNQAMKDLKTICANLKVNLEKAVTVKASDFFGI